MDHKYKMKHKTPDTTGEEREVNFIVILYPAIISLPLCFK